MNNQSIPSEEKNKNSKTPLILASIAIVAVIVIAAVLAVRSGGRNSLMTKLEQGHKYLDELEYEQALACFLAAIEIDEKNVEAYLGAAEVYIGMGEYSSAIAVLRKGAFITSDDLLSEKLAEVKELEVEENGGGDGESPGDDGERKDGINEPGDGEEDEDAGDGAATESNEDDELPEDVEPDESKLEIALLQYAGILERGEYETWDFGDETPRFGFVYIDGDDIPEMVVFQSHSHAAGIVQIFTFDGDEAVFAGTHGSYGELHYVPYLNKMKFHSRHMGTETNFYDMISDGKIVALVHLGADTIGNDYSSEIIEVENCIRRVYDSEGKFLTDEGITVEEYRSIISELDRDGFELYSYDDALEINDFQIEVALQAFGVSR